MSKAQQPEKSAQANTSTNVNATNAAQQHGVSEAELAVAARMKTAIDKKGKYSWQRDDMALGYAAKDNMDSFEAKDAIDNIFTKAFRCTPYDYMNRRYEKIKARSEARKQGNVSGRSM